MKIYSEYDLELTPLWFTGREWEDGTATRVLRQQYDVAQKDLAKHENSICKIRVKRRVEVEKPVFSPGLSPLQICQQAMGKKRG